MFIIVLKYVSFILESERPFSGWIKLFGEQNMGGINGPHINHLFYENVKVILHFKMPPEFLLQSLAAEFQYVKQRIIQCALLFP